MRTDELEKVIGGHIRNLRIGQGLTQEEVADRANVSLGALKHLESGAGATIHTLVKVLRALGQRGLARHLGARDRPRSIRSTSWPPVSSAGRAARPRRAPRRGRRHGELPSRPTSSRCWPGASWSARWPWTRAPAGTPSPTPPSGSAGGIELAPLHMPLREAALRVPRAAARDLLRAAGAAGRRPARRLRQRARSTPGWPSRACRRRHHAARPAGLRRRPGHGGARVPTAGTRRGRPSRRPPCSWPTWCWRPDARSRGEFGDDETAHAALQQLIQVGTSAGGARAKAVVAFNPATFQVRLAPTTGTTDGFEQWLIKLDGVSGTGMDGHGDRLGEPARPTGASSTPTA